MQAFGGWRLFRARVLIKLVWLESLGRPGFGLGRHEAETLLLGGFSVA